MAAQAMFKSIKAVAEREAKLYAREVRRTVPLNEFLRFIGGGSDAPRRWTFAPGKDAAVHHERDFKRARHDFPIFPRRPSAHANDHPPQQSSSAYQRAVSVPAISSVVPLLDLNNVPPSPRRSPAKFRIASIPPEFNPPEQPLPALQLTIQPPSPSIPLKLPSVSTEDKSPHSPLPALQVTQLSIRPPSPSIPPEPQHESPSSPLSPLSPLPLTEDELMPVDPAPAPSTSSSTSTSGSKSTPMPTSESRPSRLPVSSIVARMKPKTPAPAAKKARSKTFAPSVRTTRSTALRQKKVEEEAKTKAHPVPGPSATPHWRRSMSLSSYAQPTAASSAKTSPVKPASSARPSLAPPSSAFTFTAAPRMSNLVPGAAAGLSSSSKPRPGSSNGTSTLQLNSSLSTLNQALERLNAPVPARPNASRGFHCTVCGNPLTEKSVPMANAREGEEDPREDARKKQASLALAPSMGKLRTSLGFALALPPSTPAARPTLPTPSAARASMGALSKSQKRTRANPDPDPALNRVQMIQTYGSGSGRIQVRVRVQMIHRSIRVQPYVFLAAMPSGGRGIPTPSGSGSGVTKIGPPTGATCTPLGAGRSGLAFSSGGRMSLGMGARRGGIATRMLQHASKKSSLPVMIGSPVKGGARVQVEEDMMDVSEEREEGEGQRTTQEKIGDW
ncbi:hypothetical protein VTO73DRAFT_14462 [Trametes versicolor]